MARLLVTRPAPQSQALLQQLQALGHQPQCLPLMDIQLIANTRTAEAQALRDCFLDLDRFDAIIAISANAARIGWQWLDEYWPQTPIGINWFAVGPASAAPLQAEGLTVHLPEARFDSEGLLAHPTLQQVRGHRILIWRGQGGRETLAEVLRQRGAEVQYAELYQRVPCHYPDSQWQQVLSPQTWLLLSSGQALEIVQQQVLDLPQRIAGLVLPSQRVATEARQQGFSNVLVPTSARDQDVIDCIRQQLPSV